MHGDITISDIIPHDVTGMWSEDKYDPFFHEITRSDILISGISVRFFYCDWSYYFFMYHWHIVVTGYKGSNISILQSAAL